MGKRGPKSKYDPTLHPQITMWMCRSGLTNEQICKELRIAHKTLLVWANTHEEMGKALKTSRILTDSLVEDSLLKRALGYEYEETQMIMSKVPGGENKPVRMVKTKKQMAPDVTAQIFWLKNRQPDGWREKPSDLEGNDKPLPWED